LDPLLALALGAGVLSFFSPCSVGMLPAYAAMHAVSASEARGLLGYMGRGLRVGASATLGFAWTYILLGVLLSQALRVSGRIAPALNVAVACTIIVLSAAAFMEMPIPLLSRASALGRNVTSTFLYGVAYALASLGCTLPIFLMLVSYSSTFYSPAGAIAAMIVYSAGFLLMMVAFSVALTVSKDLLSNRMGSILLWGRDVGSLLSLVVGIYLLMYQIRYANPFP